MLLSCWNAAFNRFDIALYTYHYDTNEVQNAANLQLQEMTMHNWKACGGCSIQCMADKSCQNMQSKLQPILCLTW